MTNKTALPPMDISGPTVQRAGQDDIRGLFTRKNIISYVNAPDTCMWLGPLRVGTEPTVRLFTLGYANDIPSRVNHNRLRIQRRTLARHFLSLRGCNVLEELTACRLARAQRMLRETRLPIKRIAYAAGFSSPTDLGACPSNRNPGHYLDRLLAVVFRRELHTTPQQYRQTGTAQDREPGSQLE